MKGLLLISSGIDSPVAGYLMKKKGLELAGIHFSNQPFTDKKPEEMALRLLKKIGVNKCYIIKHGKNQIENLRKCNHKYQCLLCRRMMFRVAEQIALRDGFDFLVTGENLGQVASQTLDNLTVCDSVTKIKILRPLLCNDKVETMKLARKIGTYEISIEPAVCCNVVPRHPSTKARLEDVQAEEKKLDIEAMVKAAVETAELVIV